MLKALMLIGSASLLALSLVFLIYHHVSFTTQFLRLIML